MTQKTIVKCINVFELMLIVLIKNLCKLDINETQDIRENECNSQKRETQDLCWVGNPQKPFGSS